MKIRARLLRRLIAPFNWHRDGRCRFPVLCMYDDLLIWELDEFHPKPKRATWSEARYWRQQLDAHARE